MNTFLNAMKQNDNYTLTENDAVTHKSTLNGLMDLFALGGAYRNRSDEDCITLFKAALDEDEVHALKCLFYLRDIRGGQGERRFFRVCMKWLANKHPDMVRRNLELIPFYGRYDDIYCLIGTPVENDMWRFLKHEVAEGLALCEALPDE